jgi:hypothetical protein
LGSHFDSSGHSVDESKSDRATLEEHSIALVFADPLANSRLDSFLVGVGSCAIPSGVFCSNDLAQFCLLLLPRRLHQPSVILKEKRKFEKEKPLNGKCANTKLSQPRGSPQVTVPNLCPTG